MAKIQGWRSGSAGDSGQFRTPRHIIQLMVDMSNPQPTDVICDPACGTAGFLVAAVENFNKEENLKLFNDESFRRPGLARHRGG